MVELADTRDLKSLAHFERAGSSPAEAIMDTAVYTGDCLEILPTISQQADLVFVDPPFNIDYKYDKYHDKKNPVIYFAWCKDWMEQCYNILKPNGTFWVAIGPKYQAELKTIADSIGFHWRDTICWHYTFGPRQMGKFTPSWVALHYFTKDKNDFTWNPPLVPSARQLKYNDRRAVNGGKCPDNVWILMPNEYDGCFTEDQNSWLESRVAGTFKERVPHPCQMPLKVLERIVLATSNPGDLVLDPMAGSGTTLVAAKKHGRNSIGIELSENYVNNCIKPRLEQLDREHAERLQA